MYGLAYVLLPSLSTPLQEALDRTLAPFKRGGADEFPRTSLAFYDETGDLEELHRTRVVIAAGRITWRSGDHGPPFAIDHESLAEHLAACRLSQFEGSFAELEPDFDAFTTRFTRYKARDPDTGRYGRWLNPLGTWDWWELGGRFNGTITGQQRGAADHQHISSGESRGRTLIGGLSRALGVEPAAAEAEIENNVELVETLRQNVAKGSARLPSAVLLPLDCGPDAARWFDSIPWHRIRPETRRVLDASTDADYRSLVEMALDKFSDHVAAGIAFHY